MARKPASIRVGISGWTYAPWRGTFYPRGLPHNKELAYASSKLASIEINGTFYSLQRPKSYAAWYAQTPADFMFSIKGGRFITHMRRLREIEAPLANFMVSGPLCLNEKLGPILWQFPPNFAFDPVLFDHFFSLLPRCSADAARLSKKSDSRMKGRSWVEIDRDRPMRHAVEIRHDSFANQKFIRLLRKHRIALVTADTAGKWPMLFDQTARFSYVRLHGAEELYASGYTEDALNTWAGRIRQWSEGGRDVFVYFDNDVKVKAPFDAARLAAILGAP